MDGPRSDEPAAEEPRHADWDGHWEPPRAGGFRRVEHLEPRWAPDVPLAERITRVGRFRRIDPSREGEIWPKPRWWALAGYVAVLGWALVRARRITGGLDAAAQDAPRPDAPRPGASGPDAPRPG